MNVATRKIALLNDKFHGGGTERVLSYLSANLFDARNGVVFLFDDSQVDFEYGGRLAGLSVKAPPYTSTLEESFNLLKALARLRRAKKKYGVELCISQKEGPNFINVLSGVSKSVVTVHEHKSSGIRYRGAKRLLVRHLVKTLYNRADRVVAVSHEIARDLSNNFGVNVAKLEVIYNPCDIDMIAQRSAESLAEEHARLFDGPTVITAGRLVTQKGHWHLIRAFGQVLKHVSAARLLILGSGDHLGYLRRIAVQLGIDHSVHFLGYQDNPFKFIKRADIFVLTSLWEGFPAILMEAMACKVPVVSTDCPSGPREILSPNIDDAVSRCTTIDFARYGVMTPHLKEGYRSAGDPLSHGEACVAEAVVRLLEDKNLRETYAAEGLARVQEFSIDRYLSQWRDLLGTL